MKCPACGSTHRKEQTLRLCIKRTERRREREHRREEDMQRRIEQFVAVSPQEYIDSLHADGKNWGQIVAGINKLYPPPNGWLGDPKEEWGLFDVVGVWAEAHPWPGFSKDEQVLMLIEKYMTGMFISYHPMEMFVHFMPQGVKTPIEVLLGSEDQKEITLHDMVE